MVEQALEHIPACSSYEPGDTALLILDTMPLHVTSYVLYPSQQPLTQADEVQLFCEQALTGIKVVSQRNCYELLRDGLQDRCSLFHTRHPQPDLHPLAKAQIIMELHTISYYIFYVLARGPLSMESTASTQEQQNQAEFLRFVTCVQSNVGITPRVVLNRADGYLQLWQLLQQQTRKTPPGIDESLLACWCGMDFYTKWYRGIQPAYYVNYETFRIMRAASVSIFASLLFEIAEDEECSEASDDGTTTSLEIDDAAVQAEFRRSQLSDML